MLRKLTLTGKLVLLYIVLCVLFLTVARSSQAVEATFTWTPNVTNTSGYKLVMDSGTNVIQDVPGIESNTVTVTVTEECHSFAIFAYNDNPTDNTSVLSDFASWCPPSPGTVGTFIITVEQVQ